MRVCPYLSLFFFTLSISLCCVYSRALYNSKSLNCRLFQTQFAYLLGEGWEVMFSSRYRKIIIINVGVYVHRCMHVPICVHACTHVCSTYSIHVNISMPLLVPAALHLLDLFMPL